MATFAHGYALLIGVGTTKHPALSLPVTVKDMQAIHDVLTDAQRCGYLDDVDHLRLLRDASATRQGILDGLTWLQAQAQADPDATVIVYYSGRPRMAQSRIPAGAVGRSGQRQKHVRQIRGAVPGRRTHRA